jgi:hypothetical protein
VAGVPDAAAPIKLFKKLVGWTCLSGFFTHHFCQNYVFWEMDVFTRMKIEGFKEGIGSSNTTFTQN